MMSAYEANDDFALWLCQSLVIAYGLLVRTALIK